MGAVVAALDVGGTSIKAALIDRRGRALMELRRPTAVESGPDAVVAGILALAQELVETSGVDVLAVGICVPGTVESAAGIARHAVNLGWRDVPLVSLIAARTNPHHARTSDLESGTLRRAADRVAHRSHEIPSHVPARFGRLARRVVRH